MSKYYEIIEKLKAIGFTFGHENTHFAYWICPCLSHEHVVSIAKNHKHKDCFIPGNVPRGLGPHNKEYRNA